MQNFKPFLDNIGLRRDFETIQKFVTHINRTFLDFMAGFNSKSGNLSYDPDGNGRTAAKVVGHLDPELTVDHHDIHII